MKEHTTNYFNTFIEVSDDCPAAIGEIPKPKGNAQTVAQMQYELLVNHPYKFTSDDIHFQVYANKNDLTEAEYEPARKAFFSKGQPCFRTSPLTKRYGFGIHADEQGKVALVARETTAYEQFVHNPSVHKVKAMRNSKK